MESTEQKMIISSQVSSVQLSVATSGGVDTVEGRVEEPGKEVGGPAYAENEVTNLRPEADLATSVVHQQPGGALQSSQGGDGQTGGNSQLVAPTVLPYPSNRQRKRRKEKLCLTMVGV